MLKASEVNRDNKNMPKRVSRREFLGVSVAAAMGAAGALNVGPNFASAESTDRHIQADIIIYGGTPSGLAAADAAVGEGASVIMLEPTAEIGGMVTGGIAVTDTTTPYLVGGLAGKFFQEAGNESRTSATMRGSPSILFHGRKIPWNPYKPWDLEPKVARRIFKEWARKAGYKLLLNVKIMRARMEKSRIASIELSDGARISGSVFIDASYEGDLMACAGVSYTYGRESSSTYGESLAGRRLPFFTGNYSEETYATPGWEYMHHGQFGANIPARDSEGRFLPGVETGPYVAVGAADKRLQAYCFRLIATQREDLKVPWSRPDRYAPGKYELLLRYIKAHPAICFSRLVHLGSIPNGKFDLNASGPFSTDYIDGNYGYADADYDTRERMIRDHYDYQKGYFWFLAHDSRIPGHLREEVNSWGLCKDEWPDTGYWPVQLYIREARRMIGDYVMTERDVLKDKTKDDSIGMGSFVLDSHWVQRFENSKGFVQIEGHLDESIDLKDHPYDIPYRSITPKPGECRNLLVPVCLSASHVGYCSIRLEPVYMVLGHSAGVAASLAAKSEKPVQEIDTAQLFKKLTEQGQVLNYRQRKV
jgi:FAD dependent oxidoreductase